MSSYFDKKSAEVAEASDLFSSERTFIDAVADIEATLIKDVTLVVGDREFPSDLREKAMSLIAQWHVGSHAGLPPMTEAVQYLAVARCSELVDRMHSLFHELATRRIHTRFGMLNDHPVDMIHRRDDRDAA